MALSKIDGTNFIEGTVPSTVAPGAGKVLQVVQTVKTDAFSTNTEDTWIDITGLSVTITPSSSSSKILLTSSVVSSVVVITSGGIATLQHRFTGGNSASFVGDASSNRNRVAYATTYRTDVYETTHDGTPHTVTYLDSPNTTSSVTYQLQGRTGDNTGAAGTMYVNRTYSNFDISTYGFLAASTITAMEISG